MPDANTPPDLPDVLGTITGGPRLNIEAVQCAFAVYPRSTAIGQPFEALVLLQSACDKPIQVNVLLQLPRKDAAGNRVSLITPKDSILVTLQPAEVGILHVPIVPHLPTQPSTDNLVGVKFEVQAPKGYRLIRLLQGGRSATALNMSPFRLNILREVGFAAVMREPGFLISKFNVIAGQVDAAPPPAIRYETVWTTTELPKEQASYATQADQTMKVANTLTRTRVMQPLIMATGERFARVGLPLHSGECVYIAKVLTYVMEDGLDLEEGFRLIEGRWFHRLTSIINDQTIMNDSDKLVAYLYPAVMHDAIRLGLRMIERASKQTFGSAAEHVAYADQVVSALEGHTAIDLEHVYLPLVLAGLMLNAQVKGSREDLWISLGQLNEAWQSRVDQLASQSQLMLDLFNRFTTDAEQFLIRSRIPRP
jgi:hypothetical protein